MVRLPRKTWIWLVLTVAVCAGGCKMFDAALPAGSFFGSDRSALYRDFQAEDPAVRMEAVKTAARLQDRQSLPYLVDRLTDSEAEVRFAAIMALKEMTGEDRGYRYYEPAAQRAEAVGRWRQWLASRPADGPATQPAEGGTS